MITPCSMSLPVLGAEEQGKKDWKYECYDWIFLSTASERLTMLLTKALALLLRLERGTVHLFFCVKDMGHGLARNRNRHSLGCLSHLSTCK